MHIKKYSLKNNEILLKKSENISNTSKEKAKIFQILPKKRDKNFEILLKKGKKWKPRKGARGEGTQNVIVEDDLLTVRTSGMKPPPTGRK